MIISGDEAKEYYAMRLDNFENVNRGELVSADDLTGNVSWKALDGTISSAALGPHAIRIMRKTR